MAFVRWIDARGLCNLRGSDDLYGRDCGHVRAPRLDRVRRCNAQLLVQLL